MKKILVLFPTLLAIVSQAATPVECFLFRKPLTPPANAGAAVACLKFDADVFEQLDRNMDNIRLHDETGQETPFCIRKLHLMQSFTREYKFQPEILSFKELPDNRFEVIFKRRPDQPVPAALSILSPLQNFEKNVIIQVGPDGKQWTTLAGHEQIYDYSRYLNVRRDRVNVTPDNGPYYRLEISNVNEVHDSPLVEIITRTGQDPERSRTEASSFWRVPFRIDNLLLIQIAENVREDQPQRVSNALPIESITQNVTNQNTLILVGSGRRPVLSLALVTEDRNFSREVTLEGRAGESNAWRRITQGTIRSLDAGNAKQRHLTIALPSEHRLSDYRLVIHNKDNPPLTITGVIAEESVYGLQFFPRPGRAYTLLYGGLNIATPIYDVDAVLGATPIEQMDSWTAGMAIKNPDYKPITKQGASWKDDVGKTLFIAAIVVMSIGLLIMIVKTSRKLETIGNDDQSLR